MKKRQRHISTGYNRCRAAQKRFLNSPIGRMVRKKFSRRERADVLRHGWGDTMTKVVWIESTFVPGPVRIKAVGFGDDSAVPNRAPDDGFGAFVADAPSFAIDVPGHPIARWECVENDTPVADFSKAAAVAR